MSVKQSVKKTPRVGPKACQLYKTCPACKVEKWHQEFRRRKKPPTSLNAWCKDCTIVKQRERWNRSGYKRSVERFYGMSVNSYENMTFAQNNKCAICTKPPEETAGFQQKKRLSVDHDHTTGIVRGLLCNNCNLMVGYAQDDPEILRKAIAYLESHLSERTAA